MCHKMIIIRFSPFSYVLFFHFSLIWFFFLTDAGLQCTRRSVCSPSSKWQIELYVYLILKNKRYSTVVSNGATWEGMRSNEPNKFAKWPFKSFKLNNFFTKFMKLLLLTSLNRFYPSTDGAFYQLFFVASLS